MSLDLNLTFLGTGGAFTDYRVNYHNNAVVDTPVGPVLLDCGSTAVQSMKELGIKPWELAGVYITHMHADHVGGLEQLIFERYYTGEDGPSFLPTPVWAASDVHPLLEAHLTPGIDEYTANDGRVRNGGYGALVERKELHPLGMEATFGDAHDQFTFRLVRTPHVQGGSGVDKPAYGVLVQGGGCEFYFTADTIFRPNIGTLFPAADVIFHDCTFSDYYPGTVHTHYSELLTLPEDVRGRMVLMHHTEVPKGIDVQKAGFLWAASRHERFEVHPVDKKLVLRGSGVRGAKTQMKRLAAFDR